MKVCCFECGKEVDAEDVGDVEYFHDYVRPVCRECYHDVAVREQNKLEQYKKEHSKKKGKQK